jgi:ribosomal protein L7/L12
MDIELIFSSLVGIVFIIVILRAGAHLPPRISEAERLLYNAEIKLRDAGLYADKETVNIFLLHVSPEHRIETIKLLRTLTGAGLKDAKEMTEHSPSLIKAGASPEEADSIRRAFDALKAEVDIL